MTRRGLTSSVLLLLALVLQGCSSLPSKEVQELLVRKGFGRRAEGDALVENYASTGSIIQFFPSSDLLTNPLLTEIQLLGAAPQPVGIDGTIFLPLVGPTYVLGLTEAEIGALVSEKLRAYYTENLNIRIQARIIGIPTQSFFLFGAYGTRKVPLIFAETILDLFASLPPSGIANIGKVRLIRADPKNPLIVIINVRDMVLQGNTTYNLQLRENDIIYVPPTWFGQISIFLRRLLEPLNTVVSALFQGANLRYQYRILTGDETFFYPWGYGPIIY